MQVAKDIPKKLIDELIKSKKASSTTSSSMVDYISKTIKVFANSTREKVIRECSDSPKDFEKTPLILYHLRVLEDYGLIRRVNNGYLATKFAKELWNSANGLKIIPTSTLSIKILLSLTTEPRTFIELKKKLKVNEGSLFKSLTSLEKNKLIVKKTNGYALTLLADLSRLNVLILKYKELVKNISCDNSLDSLIISKEEQNEIFGLFRKKEKYYTKKTLEKVEDLISDHIIISYSYHSHSEVDEVIDYIFKEQSGLLNSKYIKPLQTFEKNTVKFAYKTNYVTTLQKILNLLCLHGIRVFDSLMIEDINFPKKFVQKFKGPKYGREGIKKLLDIKDRPLLQSVFLPEENLNIQTVKNLSKRLFVSGVDEMSDHQMITDNIQNFRARVETIMDVIDEVKYDFGPKIYYFYIYGEDYENRLDILKQMENKNIGLALSPITLGFPLASQIINNCKYPVQIHLTLHAPFTRYAKREISKQGELIPGFGINMNVLLKFFILLGGDEIHVDSPLFYHFENWETKIQCNILNYYFKELKKPFPILIGGVNPVNTLFLLKEYGKDIVLKFTTSELINSENLGFSVEKSINAFKQAIEVFTSEEHDIGDDKYEDYKDSFKFYRNMSNTTF